MKARRTKVTRGQCRRSSEGTWSFFMGGGQENQRRCKEELVFGLSLERRVGFANTEEGNRR